MTDQRGFVAQLLHRRVPQIIGLYIAATWMTIEIGEWVTERLALSNSVTLYIFIAMASMLPAVAIIAWNHGARGKDRWVAFEKIAIPVNVLLAAGAVYVVYAGRSAEPIPVAANADVVTKSLVDETGQDREFKVANSGVNRRMVAYFWSTEGGDDWVSYAIPWLLTVDLGRDLRLSAGTPYESGTVREALLGSGFDRAVNEPVSLDLQIAKDRRAQLMLVGQHRFEAGQHTLRAVLYDVASGQQQDMVEVSGASLIPLVGELADRLSEFIYGDAILTQSSMTDLALTELATSSEEALRHFIEGMNNWFFENDYELALDNLNKAVAADPQFALAYGYMGDFYRFSGKNDQALKAMETALKFDYKLDSEVRFMLKANSYAVKGQVDKAIKVLEMWTEVHPDSFDAYKILSRNYLLVSRIEDAETAVTKAAELNPGATELFRTRAHIERLKGNSDDAIRLMREYIAANPDDAEARLALGETLLQTGEFDEALEVYERVSFIAGKEYEAELAMAKADTLAGNFSRADDRLDRLMDAGTSDTQRVEIGMARIIVDMKQGRIGDGIQELEDFSDTAKKTMAPVEYIFSMPAMRAGLLAAAGNKDEALTTLDRIAEDLPAPLRGFTDISRAMVLDNLGDYAAMDEVVSRIDEFANQYNMPMLQPMVNGAKSRVLAENGDPDQAILLADKAFEEAKSSFLGTDQQVMNAFTIWRASAYRQADQFDVAREILASHLKRGPSNADARLELVRVERDAGNIDAAREMLEVVLEQWADADDSYVDMRSARAMAEEIELEVAP